MEDMKPTVAVLSIALSWLYWFVGSYIANLCHREAGRSKLWVTVFWFWYLKLAKKNEPWDGL